MEQIYGHARSGECGSAGTTLISRLLEKLQRRNPDDSRIPLWYGGSMRMTHAQMYNRLLAGDPTYNGRFFTGVLTTGIYCLPSCKARKPKAENVRFFPTCEAARAVGLRPCRKCHPDDYARGADPVLEDVETVVGEIRANPAGFADARAIVQRSGFGATRLFELFRQHYHSTPAEVLLRARIERARHLLIAGNASLTEVALAAGFESQSAFHDNFRRRNGLTPSSYRELRRATSFELALPPEYPLGYLRRALSRDPHSVTERWEGEVYTTAIRLSGGPALLTLRLAPDHVHVRVTPPPKGAGSSSHEEMLTNRTEAMPAVEAHAIAAGLLGLDQDAAAFARLTRKLGLARLIAGRAELRISQTPSVFDGLLWSIVGQQINFPFACLLKRRLTLRAGTPLANGLYVPPTPASIAQLDPADLLSLQFSRQKADYVVSIARLIAADTLDLTALKSMSATRAERTLLTIRGLGPWSVNYLMMRSLNFADCVPLGDTGVASGLRSLFQLEERPDLDAMRRLMGVFAPFRSLATAHLWQLEQPVPGL